MKNDFREFYDEDYIAHASHMRGYSGSAAYRKNPFHTYIDKIKTATGKWRYIYPDQIKRGWKSFQDNLDNFNQFVSKNKHDELQNKWTQRIQENDRIRKKVRERSDFANVQRNQTVAGRSADQRRRAEYEANRAAYEHSRLASISNRSAAISNRSADQQRAAYEDAQRRAYETSRKAARNNSARKAAEEEIARRNMYNANTSKKKNNIRYNSAIGPNVPAGTYLIDTPTGKKRVMSNTGYSFVNLPDEKIYGAKAAYHNKQKNKHRVVIDGKVYYVNEKKSVNGNRAKRR